MTPDDIDVWVGLDVGKSAHHAHALDHDGNTLYDKPLKHVLLQCLFDRFGSVFPQCGLMVFPGVVIVSR